jgi:shikimate dehydrogenase
MTNTTALHAISGETRLFAIIGDPIAQARSPAVFNALFSKTGANAVLVPMQVPASQLPTAIEGLKSISNLDGIVVTVPHKVSVVELLDDLGPVASRVGAVNCMRRFPDGRWGGEMFDGEGFVLGLQRGGFPVDGQRVFQAGCGGAGKAVAHALAAAGAAMLHLVDVRPDLVQALIASLRRYYPGVAVHVGDAPHASHDLLINATPCGMAQDDPLPFDLRDAAPTSVVADLIMKPEHTRLLNAAQARGLRTHLGRHLLESQAALVASYFGLGD